MKNLSLTYCTNVHPLGDWDSWSTLLSHFGAAIRSELGWNSLPLGLWFPASLATDLEKDSEKSSRLIQKLFQDHGLSAFTCNAFPYGNFQDKVVKTRVYHPDWTLRERLDYSLTCARILASVMEKGGQGSLSTLPLGWRIGWKEKQSSAAVRHLLEYVKSARELADHTGRQIRLAIEPEPGCVLETVEQVVDFWNRHLRPAAKAVGISSMDLDSYCGICYDTCHQSVQFESPIAVLETLRSQGIPIAKMQLSSALEFNADANGLSLPIRKQFIEERFLHQTRVKTPTGILNFDDLPQALLSASEGIDDLWSYPWRVHFHLPIYAKDMLESNFISTTREDMLQAMTFAINEDLCHHFEIETYTWSVLPEAHRPKSDAELAKCIARELRFISDHLLSDHLLSKDLPKNFTVNGRPL